MYPFKYDDMKNKRVEIAHSVISIVALILPVLFFLFSFLMVEITLLLTAVLDLLSNSKKAEMRSLSFNSSL